MARCGINAADAVNNNNNNGQGGRVQLLPIYSYSYFT